MTIPDADPSPDTHGDSPTRRAQGWLMPVFVIAVVAAAFRLPYLTSRSIWYDEASSWWIAKMPLAEMIDHLRRNVHMPLYYLVLKGWMAVFGDSALAIRGLSVALGVATAVGFYFVARELLRSPAFGSASGDPAIPWFAGLLVAVNAFQVNAGVEARMYALGTALTAWSAFALVRVVSAPDRRRWWALWIGLCAALTYSHHHCLFVVLGQFAFLAGFALFRRGLGPGTRRTIVLRGLLAAAAVVLAYIPGVFLLLAQIRRVRQDYWTEPLSPSLVGHTFAEFFSPLLRLSPASAMIGWLSLGLFAVATIVLLYRPRPAGVFVVVLGWLPLVAAAVVTLAVTPVWEGRFFRFAQPFLLLTLALATWKAIKPRGGRVAVASICLVGFGAASVDFWIRRDVADRPGMRGAIARIFEKDADPALIVSTSNIHYLPARYYVGDRAEVRILRSGTNEFWTDSVIGPSDIATDEELDGAGARGFWVLSHSPVSGKVSELRGVVVDRLFVVPYDRGVPDWKIYVSYVRRLGGE